MAVYNIDGLFLSVAPPLDPAWLEYEREAGLWAKKEQKSLPPLERQIAYATECRELHAKLMAPGERDFHLSQGVSTRWLNVSSTLDGAEIPVLEYTLDPNPPADEEGGVSGSREGARTTQQLRTGVVVVYYHGGGLCIGEADSEDLSCRRILKATGLTWRIEAVYSVGYRLMPRHPASTCVADSLDAFGHIRDLKQHTNQQGDSPPRTKLIVVGSSSGGQLAALVSQTESSSVSGVLLRGPVTSDAFSGREFVPPTVRDLHTSATEPSFRNVLMDGMSRAEARDGLPRMPLEAPQKELLGLPRTWIQVCTNDALYSDGVCYANLLRAAGVHVRVHVVRGWPHTFWLVAPHLPQSLQADEAMLKGFAWICGGDEQT